MSDTRKYVVPPDADISDIDLNAEEVYLPDGRRLTEELAQHLAEEALAAVRRRNLIPGRKSLSGGEQHSPVVRFRVPVDLRAALEERARQEHKTLSRVAREALERYLAS